MLRIGKAYKGKDYATDVLTFNYSKDEVYEKGDLLGEIYVNLDAAKKQAKENNIKVEREIAHLVEHAMLHMQGIHHKGDGK
ncbi:rRNA maturation RNase YbeY [Patescibacteria group bacterium]|nr:rRNA maturation RNase YbeY [Patescibacteria group bacterium]